MNFDFLEELVEILQAKIHMYEQIRIRVIKKTKSKINYIKKKYDRRKAYKKLEKARLVRTKFF